MKIDLIKNELVDRAEKSTEKKAKVTIEDIYEQNAVIIEMLSKMNNYKK